MTDQNIVNHKAPKQEVQTTPTHKTSGSEATSDATSFATPRPKGKGRDNKRKSSSSPPAKRPKVLAHDYEDGEESEGASAASTPLEGGSPLEFASMVFQNCFQSCNIFMVYLLKHTKHYLFLR